MSATIQLLKPVDVTVQFGEYYSTTPAEQEEIDKNCTNFSQEEWNKYFEPKYSDGKHHEYMSLSVQKRPKHWRIKKYRNKRVHSYEKKIKQIFKKYVHQDSTYLRGGEFDYICYDEICYRQGWFFNKDFWRKNETFFYAFTKEEMIKLLDRYLQSKHLVPCLHSCVDVERKKTEVFSGGETCTTYYAREDYDIQKIKQDFIDAWNSQGCYNLIFVISF